MKEAYWGYWLVILGVFVAVILLLVRNVTSNNTEDYYNGKEIVEQAMVDAIDYGYFRYFGELRINKEKFMENFVRRFADSVNGASDYNITFVALYEAPPKVSVEIQSKTDTYVVGTDATAFDLTNRVTEILEQNQNS